MIQSPERTYQNAFLLIPILIIANLNQKDTALINAFVSRY